MTRRWHRWTAILVALPFLVVILTGILLQLKKDWSWIQPATGRGIGRIPEISFNELLDAVRSAHPTLQAWDDIERIDVQPGRGIAKVHLRDHWEIQVDLKNAAILQKAYRRSDFIEAIHDGSWFHEGIKLWVFLPTAVIVLLLWITGMYLFVLPYVARWSKRKKAARTRSSDRRTD